jgi:hypothetical protein
MGIFAAGKFQGPTKRFQNPTQRVRKLGVLRLAFDVAE